MIDRVLANSYRVVEKVGEGGMGAVYRAVDLMLERDVAIKAIKPELARDPEMVERFRTEARTLARVSHPAIATIYSFFEDGGELFLAMEYVRGRSLSKVLEAEGALPWDRAVRLISSVLDGMAEAHHAGVVHRDLKPDNLMITETGAVKVTDFGIARMVGAGHLTRTGLLVGTLRYMAPEQIQGEEADARSDIYSLGGVFYQMLTGRPAFDGKSDYAILKAQIEEMPPPPSTAAPAPGIPEWIDRAVLLALAKKPAGRFQSVEEMRRFLDSRGAADSSRVSLTASLLPPLDLDELPTVVTPPRGMTPPLPPLPPLPAPPRITPPPLPTMASGAPPLPAGTDASLNRPVPAEARPSRGCGWKLAVGAAAVVALLTGVFLATYTDDTPGDAPGPTPAAAESPDPGASGAPEAPGETPAPSVVIIPAGETPAPQPSATPSEPSEPATDAAPDEEPEETDSPADVSVDGQTPETGPAAAPAAPIDELKQLGTELQAQSAKLLDTYQAFLDQKEDDGGELTDDDEELSNLIESFADSAEKLNKQIQGGGFLARLRRRNDTETRLQIVKHLKDLVDRATEVNALMMRVRPSEEVRQAWQELHWRCQRAARLVAALQ
jgi:serine/threonine-protein kinase